MYVHTYLYIDISINICMIHIHIYIYIYVYVFNVYTYPYICIFMKKYMITHIYACSYMYIYSVYTSAYVLATPFKKGSKDTQLKQLELANKSLFAFLNCLIETQNSKNCVLCMYFSRDSHITL
jgi:hypothetical protein